MKTNLTWRLVVFIYILTLLLLVIYSYTQIDLNLTLSSNAVYQDIQRQLISIGYYKRQVSTTIYLTIVSLLLAFQLYALRKASSGTLQAAEIFKLAVITATLLLFSYPALSHDVFNYIFDARIVVYHHKSPWSFTALDFPQDLWTRFMRWTHRTYPYGPLWLLITLPFYLAGLGKFTATLFWFKVLAAASYILSVFFIKRILEKNSNQKLAAGLVFFALNPLIIIESLMNSHLDIVMTSIFLLAIYALIVRKKRFLGLLAMFLSAGIKYITVASLPVWFWWKGEKRRFSQAITIMLTLVLLATAYVVAVRELLPWYFITPLALAALLPEKKTLSGIGIIWSVGLLLRYVPYLLRGDYSPWVKNTRDILTALTLGIIVIMLWAKKKRFFLLSS